MKLQQPKNLLSLFSLILSLFTINAIAQPATRGNIHGQIITIEHKPAENVSVVLKDTRFGTLSDENGNYSFRVPAGTYTVVISHVGAKTIEVQVTLQAGQTVKVQPQVVNLSATALQEIVVSDNKANKFAKKQSDAVAKMPLKNLENAQVYTTISKELLTEQINTNFNDALKNTSGLDKLWTSTGRSGDGAAYYSLRGFTIQPTMVNGIAGLTNGDLDPANIEKIEVIKGPSGALFGGALTNFGGLINIVTKRPIDTIGGQIGYSAGNFSLSRLSADVYGPISKDKKLLGRVNAAYSYQNSFQDAGFRRSLFIAPSLEYRASDRFKLNLDAEFYNYEGTNPLSVFLNRSRQLIARTPDELNFDWNRSYTSNDITIRTPTTNIRGLATYKISDQWTSQTSFSSSTRKTDGYNQYVMYIGASDTLLNRYASMQNSTSNVVDIQQNFNGDFKIGEMRNRIVVGLDFLNQETNNNNSPYILFDQVNSSRNDPRYVGLSATTLYARLGATTTAYTKNRTISNVYSIYASDVLNITDQLLATASLRLDRFDNKGTYTLPTNLTAGSYTQNALSPKFGLVYQVVKDQLSVFGNYMNGFRNVSPVVQPLADISGIFKPQQANQIEGGIKADAFNNRLTFTASYYDISVDNLTRSEALVRNGQTYNITVQDGTQKSKGFELDLIANPLNGLNIIAGYSHNDSKLVKADPSVIDRRPVSAGPANLANAWISYTQPKGKFSGLGIGLGGNYASNNVITNSVATGEFTLPEYAVFNSTLFYSTKQYRLGIKVDNLTDKLYYKGWTTVEPQMPRSIVANVTFKF